MSAALALSEEELVEITGYLRPTNQLKVLQGLGIPARRRPDNTILVLRMHLIHPASIQPAANAPQRKSARK